jgi:transcriptional/translational regulatory protein YebC/TACO1
MEAAIEAGADDVLVDDDGSIEVLTAPSDFETVQDALRAAGLEPAEAEIAQRSSLTTELDEEGAASMIKLLDMLEDLDDVQNVFSNADISEEILAKL